MTKEKVFITTKVTNSDVIDRLDSHERKFDVLVEKFDQHCKEEAAFWKKFEETTREMDKKIGRIWKAGGGLLVVLVGLFTWLINYIGRK